ncbi:hypothetical protein BD560DRAFT_326367, partial [Blakeslea trispora]
NVQFLREDGQGHVVDENGFESMDLVVDEDLFAIETMSCRTQFLMNKSLERPSNPVIHSRNNEDVDMELCNKRYYTLYSDEVKTRSFHLFFSKSLKILMFLSKS